MAAWRDWTLRCCNTYPERKSASVKRKIMVEENKTETWEDVRRSLAIWSDVDDLVVSFISAFFPVVFGCVDDGIWD